MTNRTTKTNEIPTREERDMAARARMVRKGYATTTRPLPLRYHVADKKVTAWVRANPSHPLAKKLAPLL